MNDARARVSLVLVALFLGGCVDLFDASLYMAADDAGAGVDAALGLTGPLAEVCGAEAPMLAFPEGAAAYEFDLDTRTNSDNSREVSSCTGREQGGPDLFMSIDAARGDHWHFHIDVDPFEGRATANPAIYVLRDCDERACSIGEGLDLCGAGSDEHFTFIPEAADRYVVGFDSPAEGFEGRILAFRTVCGDGRKDHSENGDDGNLESGDGCDSRCRTELSGASPMEVAINDDLYAANAVTVPVGTAVPVRAALSSICESDVFAVDVPAGGDLAVTLQAPGGGECPTELVEANLQLVELSTSGPSVLVRGSVVEGSPCPSIGATDALACDLPAGTYFVVMTLVRDRADSVDYQLSLGVSE